MKGVSLKKVFKVVGVVLAAVLGFVGSVVGVMAAMGKFKTPVVYPTVLEFAIREQTIIERKTFDTGLKDPTGTGGVDWKSQDATIYSFVLSGTNPSEEHAVNKKDCYLWFNDASSQQLITLCDIDGKPLEADSNNRFLVKCNEPIYYMVNKVDYDEQTDGKVLLQARSVNENLKRPEYPMTIWIDRSVESVYVKDLDWTDDYFQKSYVDASGVITQEISVGVDVGFGFTYFVGAGKDVIDDDIALSIKPIEKESAKEIELYYNVEGMNYGTDYLRVTEDEILKAGSPLNSILTYENGVVKFKASSADKAQHVFYVAVFRTYQAKEEYYASIEGMSINQPNYHKLINADMAITTFKVNVLNVDVTNVELAENDIVLNLYQNDKIYIQDETKHNNLGLTMLRKDENTSIEDTTRFDEVDFVDFTGDVWSERTPIFISQTDEDESWEYEGNITGVEVKTTPILIGGNLKIVDYVRKTGTEDKLYCGNGVAVWNEENNTIQLLNAGSYLSFYLDNAGEYIVSNFECDIEANGSGTGKYWDITSKTMPDGDLFVGILVVNNSGLFIWNNFFKTRPVTVSSLSINAEYLKNSQDFEITFEEGGEENIQYQEFDFNHFINIQSGSYNACVLVAPVNDDGGEPITQIVETIDTIIFNVDGKDYVLVGYINEENGKFVNAVKVNSDVTINNKSCKLYMLQMKNDYEESVNDIIDPILTTGKVFSDQDVESDLKIVNLYDQAAQTITINAKYVLNSDLLAVKFYKTYIDSSNNEELVCDGNGAYSVYENTSGHKFVITSTNSEMIKKIVDFYAVNEICFNVEYANLVITSTSTGADGEFIAEFEAKTRLTNENTEIGVQLINIGSTYNVGKIKVLNGSPDEIVLNVDTVGAVDPVNLYDSEMEAMNAEKFIKVVVGYDSDLLCYTYKFYLNNILIVDNIFNVNISSPTDLGFQGAEDKGQTLMVEYNSTDNTIFNTNNLNSMSNLVENGGNAVLSVTIGETTRYIKISVDTSAFEVQTTDNKTYFEKQSTTVSLTDLMTLTHSENVDPLVVSRDNLVKIAINQVKYDEGELKIFEESGKIELIQIGAGSNGEDITILEVINDATNGWQFVKSPQSAYVGLSIRFDVQTVAGTTTIELRFGSNVSVAVNDAWEEKVLYAGTQVLLVDYNDDSYALFNVTKGPSDAISFSIRNVNIDGDVWSVPTNKIG